MAILDEMSFEMINPSRFTTFTFPNPSDSTTSLLRVAVLDSPFQPPADPPRVAAMLVPKHRHSDWIFSTHSGHLHLLLSTPNISRLILIGDRSHHSPPIYCRPLKNDTSCDNQLGVMGVEADVEVLSVSRRYFGLEDGEHIKVCVGDALEFIDKLAGACEVEAGCDVGRGNDVNTKFDVIMVDLDSSDARDGLIAPPLEFVRKHVLLSARSILSDNGILAINVIPPNTSFYKTLIHEFRDVFNDLFEIDMGNGENFILIAVASPLMPSSDCENCFLSKLGNAILEAYLNSIKKI